MDNWTSVKKYGYPDIKGKYLVVFNDGDVGVFEDVEDKVFRNGYWGVPLYKDIPKVIITHWMELQELPTITTKDSILLWTLADCINATTYIAPKNPASG